MRKVLSFVLVLSLVLGSLGMAFAAMPDVAGEDFEDAVNVLTDLGVVTGYPDGTYRPDNIVTRAEMAVFVVNALGLADYAIGASSFKDMAGHWSNAYVNYANALGVVSGYPDGTFRPDKTVSYDEAATMLVGALGYTPESLVGTWPANYVSKAKTLGILDGIVAGSAGANRGDVATMVFQTLDQNIGKTDKDGKWEATVLKDDGTTKTFDRMLGRLGAELKDDGNPFVLKTSDAKSAVANVMNLAGAYVTAYVNDGEIIGISDVKSVFLTGKYNAADGLFETDDVDYNTTGVSKYTVTNPNDTDAIAFVNGVGETTTSPALSDGFTYTIAAKVSGKTIKEIYSVGTWVVDAASQVDKFDVEAIEKDQELLRVAFELDDNDEIDYRSFALFGVNSLDEIKVDHVVYVYDNGATPAKVSRVEVGTEVIEGKVTSINSAKTKYTIGGKVYDLSGEDGAITSGSSILAVKNEVKAYLDYNGDIYEAEKISGEADKIAIVLQTESRDTSKIATSEAKVNLFLADGTEKVFTVKKDADIMSGNNVNVSNGALIKYSVNNDGVIDKIVTMAGVARDSATNTISEKGYVDGKELASDVTVFTYDGVSIGAFYTTDAALEAEDFGVSKRADVLGNEKVAVLYTLNSSGLVNVLVVAGGTSTDEVYGVMVGHGTDDSVESKYAEMLVDGAKVKYSSKTDPTGLSFTSVYAITFNANGSVNIEANAVTAQVEGFDSGGSGTTPMAITLDGYVFSVASAAGITTAGSILLDTKYTLDKDVAVYVSDGTKYKLGKLADVRGQAVEIRVFDTDETPDGVYDIVLIEK